jgi:hypothetical protein
MFGLSLVDHLRLTFGHVIYSHKAHAQAADRYARWDRWLKAAEVVLMLATAVSAVALTYTTNSAHAITTAVAAVAAVVVLVVRLALDFDRIAATHRACSAHLWHMREQYRALLADLHDNVLSPEDARNRRDQLMAALHGIYQHAPPADREEYENARRALGTTDETALSDEEIDRFLPASLKKAAGQ